MAFAKLLIGVAARLTNIFTYSQYVSVFHVRDIYTL